MGYSLSLVAAPAEEPLSTAEAKAWLRIDPDVKDDDALIDGLVRAARRLAERLTGRQLVTATWRLDRPAFTTSSIRLPRPPLRAVTSVTYRDLQDSVQTLPPTVYGVDTGQDPGVLYLKQYQVWPPTRISPVAVSITYQAGYGPASSVPDTVKLALKVAIAQWYEQRGDGLEAQPPDALPAASAALLASEWNGELEYGDD